MSYRRSPKRSRHSRSHSRSRTRDRDYRDDRRRDDRDYRDRGSSKQPSTKHSDEDQSKISTHDCLNIYFVFTVCLSFRLSVFRLPSICPKTSFNSCSRMYHKHPSLEQDLSLKIEERDQTIWICMLEL